MFWCYFTMPTVYMQSQQIILAPTNSVPPNSSKQESINPTHPNLQIQNLFINLTKEDLEKAGYENKKKPWTEEEDEILMNCLKKGENDWQNIAKLLPGRNDKMCYSRYQRLKNQTKIQWKNVDNQKLITLVEELGSNWKEICKYFQKRNPKQIKQHYLNYLRPGIRKEDWTLEEDLKLVKNLNLYGTDWKALEKEFEGRTQNQIKNRYFGRLKKLAEKKLTKTNSEEEVEIESQI